ncbi:MAG: hypothetical protein N2C14_12655, partial [Planctomycetales bacterium]
MSWIRSSATLFVASVILVASSGATRGDELTEAIPADSQLVVVARNFEKSHESATGFLTQAGSPIPIPDVNVLKGTFGWGKVWQTDQPVAMVLPDLAAAAGDPLGQAVWLAHVEDFDAAMKQLDAERDGDVYKFAGMVGFSKGSLLIASRGKAALEPFRAPKKSIESRWSASQKKMRTETDVFYFVHAAALKPGLEAGIGALEQGFKSLPAEAIPGTNPKQILAIYGLYFKGIRAALDQADSIHGGLQADKDRVLGHVKMLFKPGTAIRKAAESREKPMKSLLAGLPDMPFYMAFAADTKGSAEWMNELSKAILEMPEFAGNIKEKLTKEQREKMLKANQELSADLDGFNMVREFTSEGMLAVGRYFYRDPAKAQKAMRENLKFSQALMGATSPIQIDGKV